MSAREREYVRIVTLMWLTGPIQGLHVYSVVWKRGLDAISHYGYIGRSV